MSDDAAGHERRADVPDPQRPRSVRAFNRSAPDWPCPAPIAAVSKRQRHRRDTQAHVSLDQAPANRVTCGAFSHSRRRSAIAGRRETAAGTLSACALRCPSSLLVRRRLGAAARRRQSQVAESTVDSGAALGEMTLADIGPFRGGRTKAVAGIPSQPNVFYIGAVNGGVWKTTDAGRTWVPIFDDQPTGSIGAIAVAPSDPNIIYVGSGEGMQRPDLSTGDGIYKSTDAGRTWTHLGLRDGQQIPHIVVDPRDPESAVRRGARPPVRPERRARHLPIDRRRQDVRARALQGREHRRRRPRVRSGRSASTIYAALWEARQGPWENAAWTGPGSGLFKSTDGGTTWRPLTQGPADVRRGTRPASASPSRRPIATRLYAVVDAGAQRRHLPLGRRRRELDPRERRPAGRSRGRPTRPTFACIPPMPTSSSCRRSSRGSRPTAARRSSRWRGAPGGDDYQQIWINPTNPDVMIMTADQGAVVTLNGGETWSSWYNQPTAQFYHVSTDNAFPYRVCGGQQESGSACVVEPRRPRTDHVARLDAGRRRGVRLRRAGSARSRHRLRRQGHAVRSADRPGAERRAAARADLPRAAHGAGAVLRRPIGRTLFFAANTLWKTVDGRPDLDGDQPRPLARTVGRAGQRRRVPRSAPTAQPTRRGVIYTVAPSPIDPPGDLGRHRRRPDSRHARRRHELDQRDAAGDRPVGQGLAHRSVALRHRTSPTPPSTRCGSTTCARTSIRTSDGGKTLGRDRARPAGDGVRSTPCAKIRSGAACSSPGSEQAVSVSFDDGENWQSLRLNMPATSIRDLVDQGRGPRRRHARPRLLDSRRHHAAPADHAGRASRRRRTCSGRRRPGGSAGNKNTDTPVAARRAGGAESAGRRDLSYLLGAGRAGPGDARDHRDASRAN